MRKGSPSAHAHRPNQKRSPAAQQQPPTKRQRSAALTWMPPTALNRAPMPAWATSMVQASFAVTVVAPDTTAATFADTASPAAVDAVAAATPTAAGTDTMVIYRAPSNINGDDENAAATAGAMVCHGASPATDRDTAEPSPPVECPVCGVQIVIERPTQQQRQIALAKHLNVAHSGAHNHAEIARQIEHEELFRCRFCHQFFGFKATHHEEVRCRRNPNPTPADQYEIDTRARNADSRARRNRRSGGCASFAPT